MPRYRARERGQERIYGKEADSYKLLPDYVRRLKEANPGTFAKIRKNRQSNRFKAIFIALGSLIHAVRYIRPFYALDGTHIRSKYNLTLLIAVGIDGEDHVLPLAWAIVPKENKYW
jgi:hypothetical protein